MRIATLPMFCPHACLGDGSAPSVRKFAVGMKTADLQVKMVYNCGWALRYLMRFSQQSSLRAKSWGVFWFWIHAQQRDFALRLSSLFCGSKFSKQFIDTEMSAPIIKSFKYYKYLAQERWMIYILNPVEIRDSCASNSCCALKHQELWWHWAELQILVCPNLILPTWKDSLSLRQHT